MTRFECFFLVLLASSVFGQINLGTLNLNKNQNGDLEFGVGQSANIFGFGGDRELAFTVGPGKFDTQLGGGALIGGERLGLDSGVGVKEGQNFNIGSQLKFGNAPPNPNDPAGQLNAFINNVGYFFQRFMPPPGSPAGLVQPRPTPPAFTRPSGGAVGINSGEFVDPDSETPTLIPQHRMTRPERITTEGRQNKPKTPEGLASIEETDSDSERLADLQ